MDTNTPPTREEIENMRAMVAAADAAAAAEAAAERASYMAPAKNLCESDEFAFVLKSVQDMIAGYEGDEHMLAHLNGLAMIMPNLSGAAGVALPDSTGAPAPITPVASDPTPTAGEPSA